MAVHQNDYNSFLYSFYRYSEQRSWPVGWEWMKCPACGWSDGNWAGDDAILQHHAEHQEDEVEQEHGGAQNFVHLPLAGRDGDDDKEKHDEEQHDGTEEAVAADGDRSQTVEERVEEPRHRKSSRRKHRRMKHCRSWHRHWHWTEAQKTFHFLAEVKSTKCI